jgi:hypothetical protein
VDVYPELECWPHSLLSKSRAFTRLQLLSAQILAPAGMTAWVFRGQIVWAEGQQDVLGAALPYLNRGLAAGVFARPRQGVAVLISEDSAATLRTARGEDMSELYPREYLFGAVFGRYGIPFRYVRLADAADLAGEVVAVSGQLFRNLDPDAIRALFRAKRLVLDAEAVETLLDVGLGDLVAARGIAWPDSRGTADSPLPYFEDAAPDRSYLGQPPGMARAIIDDSFVALVDYTDAARVRPLTLLRDHRRVTSWPGHAIVDSQVLIVPFGKLDPLDPVPLAFSNALRGEVLRGAIAELAPRLPALEATDAALYAYPEPGGMALYLVNGSLDTMPQVRLRVGSVAAGAVTADPSWAEAGPVAFSQTGDWITVELAVPPLEAVLLRLRKKTSTGPAKPAGWAANDPIRRSATSALA